MKVLKRDGRVVDFDKSVITRAIQSTMRETKSGVDIGLSEKISKTVEKEVLKKFEKEEVVYIEYIQDIVEDVLQLFGSKELFKKYVVYRDSNEKKRKKQKPSVSRLLSDEFISKYKHLPSPMAELGNFVYYRTYSRYLPDESRREYWWETVRRAVEYNAGLGNATRKEAEDTFDAVYNMQYFLSGRTFWVGGTEVGQQYPMANFNCSHAVIDNIKAFTQIFYLLMLGSGAGVNIKREYVSQLPKVRTDYELIHKQYEAKPKDERKEHTGREFKDNTVFIEVGDSKEGWVDSLEVLLEILFLRKYKNIKTIVISYDNVRPKGEKLKRFGGTASGHESLMTMFKKIDRVIKNAGEREGSSNFKVRPIDCLDIANIIGENVVSGGVRRTAEIILFDSDDEEVLAAKSHLYTQVDDKWVLNKNIEHRQMSNNSIFYDKKPTRERLHWQIEKMRFSGEPGSVNGEAIAKRRPNGKGVNPCGEILLDNKGLCNLVTLVLMSLLEEIKEGVTYFKGTNKKLGLSKEKLAHVLKLATRSSYRMTLPELELPDWNAVQQKDRLIGVSFTGWQDMINALGLNKEDKIEILKFMRAKVHEYAKEYADELGLKEPLLATTIKPEGTLSQLPTVSSGVHFSHSPYYIRRVRISSSDPLVKVCEELGWSVKPEVGQDWETCKTKVVEFPVKAPNGRTKYDVSAIEQLEEYKLVMEHYVDHNCSITVHVRGQEEWNQVEEWWWNNWDDVVALSFLDLDDNFYDLMPYESITEEEYMRMKADMKPFIPSLISKYENEFKEDEDLGEGCETGVCPIR